MNYLILSLLVLVSAIISGCTPLSAVSMIGSTLSRTIEREQQKKAEEPVNNRIAVTSVSLGVEYMRQGQYEKALAKLNRALEVDPGYALAYNALGVLYQFLNDPVQAEVNFKKSLKIDKENSPAMNNYGQFLCKQNRYKEAEEYFLAAASNPFYTTPEIAFANAGSCAYINKRIDVAVKYFEKCLTVNPDIPVALSQMAQIRFDAGDYITAGEYLDRYLMVARHTARSLWLGIQIQRQLGDLDKLASYTLLLRNQFPDTDEAELLNKNTAYALSRKPRKIDNKLTWRMSEQNGSKKVENIQKKSMSPEVLGLLGGAELSFYPLLLDGAELLGLE